MTFLEIRDRLLSIQAPDATTAAEHVRRAETMAARRFKQCHDEGKPGIFQIFDANSFPVPKPSSLTHESEREWFKLWQIIRVAVRDLDSVLSPATLIGGAIIVDERRIESEKGHGVTGRIVYRPEDWQLRARDDADICKILAEVAGEAPRQADIRKPKARSKRRRNLLGTERQKAILEALRDCGGKVSQAANELGISRQRVSAVKCAAERAVKKAGRGSGQSVRPNQTTPERAGDLSRDKGKSDRGYARKLRVRR